MRALLATTLLLPALALAEAPRGAGRERAADGDLTSCHTLPVQARIVPRYANGVAKGFRLFGVQPGSRYAAMGIRDGDVVLRIDGQAMDTPEQAIELLRRLLEASHVTFELERAGKVIRKEYNVSGP
jgi:general secretion pathway protein C